MPILPIGGSGGGSGGTGTSLNASGPPLLVGDCIIQMRELGPDRCQVLLQPIVPTIVPAIDPNGNFPSGSVVIAEGTFLTHWGETIPSVESNQVTITAPNNAFAITFPYIPPEAVAVRVYYTLSTSGTEAGYQQFAAINGGSQTINITAAQSASATLSAVVSATPPVESSAYLPDTDGGFVKAFTAYGWLNKALQVLARAAGGIQDTCGIASVSGQRRYVAPGQWLRLTNAFYDGWELDMGNRAETFRNRNLTANISISLMADAQSDTTRLELYWTPSRTSGQAVTTAAMAATDVNIAIGSFSGWLLNDGMAQVGNEIVSYSAITSTQMQNMIRGWNGTRSPLSLASGATIKELNIELVGYRMPARYGVGDSALSLGVPPGWEPFVVLYMLGMFRDAEQERQEAASLKKEATEGIVEWAKQNKPVAGPRQCRMYGDYGIRGLVPGGLTGGIIIP